MRLTMVACGSVLMMALAPAAPAQRQTFSAQVLAVSGMSAGGGAALEPDDEIDGGEIWIADLNTNTHSKIAGSGYRTPVFAPGGDAVLAIRDDVIVKIPVAGGKAEDVFQLDSISKLVGFVPDGRLLVTADDNNMIGFLALPDGKARWLTPDDASAEDKAAVERIRGWERVYGGTKVMVQGKAAGGKRSTDVYAQESGKEPVNVSAGEGVSCGQPAFLPDHKLVVYVRAQP